MIRVACFGNEGAAAARAALWHGLSGFSTVGVFDLAHPDLVSSRQDLNSHLMGLLRRTKPAVLDVSATNDAHADIVRIAIQAGVSMILCPAPFCRSAAEVAVVSAIAQRENVQLIVQQPKRFYRSLKVVKAALTAEQIGRIENVWVNHCNRIGIDGANARLVFLFGRCSSVEQRWEGTAIARFDTGLVATIDANPPLGHAEDVVVITGERGNITVHVSGRTTRRMCGDDHATTIADETDIGADEIAQFSDIADMIMRGAPIPPEWSFLTTAQMRGALGRAAKLGRAVDL